MTASTARSTPGATVPSAAERARSVAARGGSATVLPSAGCGRVSPSLHHVLPSGDTVLLLDREHPLVDAARSAPRQELPAMLEVTDPAPVPLREPVRGLLWITGWVLPLDADEARAAALRVAESRPDPRLLDVGHATTAVQLRPASLILADAEGTESVRPDEFSAAAPDPFCLLEADWLRHLESRHPDVLAQLLRHVPARLRRRGVQVRPLAVDRFGVRLRIEGADGSSDVRIRFSRPAADLRQLGQEFRLLLGCPFLRGRHDLS